jgi:hypothetical protein
VQVVILVVFNLLPSSDSELTSETVRLFIHFDRIFLMGDQSIVRPLPTQDSTI